MYNGLRPEMKLQWPLELVDISREVHLVFTYMISREVCSSSLFDLSDGCFISFLVTQGYQGIKPHLQKQQLI
jgi:hypothetical protein